MCASWRRYVNYAFEDGVEPLVRLLGVPVDQRLHGPFQVGKQYRYLLALTFENGFGGEDLLREVRRDTCLWPLGSGLEAW